MGVVISNGLQAERSKDKMVDALLKLEAAFREASQIHGQKLLVVTAKKKEELESKTNAELKDLCTNKGIKPGTAREDRVERLLESAMSDGDLEKMIVTLKQSERHAELFGLDNDAISQVCEKASVNPFVKD